MSIDPFMVFPTFDRDMLAKSTKIHKISKVAKFENDLLKTWLFKWNGYETH